MDQKKTYTKVIDEVSDIALKSGRKPEEITIIAVSKKQNIDTIKKGIEAGIKNLGENYIQEAVDKIEQISDKTLSWHFIGHLQSNKSKFAVKHFDLIHSVDSIKLAREINRQAKKINKTQNILIQINISEEESKSGIKKEEALILAEQIGSLENVKLTGIMGMPPFSIDPEKTRKFFQALKKLKDYINDKNIASVNMHHLSMGMSQDYKVAIEEGSTMVRIGTKIFGPRQ